MEYCASSVFRILLGLLCKPTTNCTVHAFEAIPAKANQLPEEARKRQSTKHLTRFFHAHAAGLGKVTSTLVLYPPGSPKSYNNYKVAVNGFVPPLARPNAINVPIVSLDDFLQREGLLKPSGVFYMKVDIEGGEVGVMEGGSRALAMGAIDYFSFEYAFAWSSAFRNTSLSALALFAFFFAVIGRRRSFASPFFLRLLLRLLFVPHQRFPGDGSFLPQLRHFRIFLR